MNYFMGIDGGGSTIRVVIVSPDLSILGKSHGPATNPNSIGQENAVNIIQQAIREALHNANLSAEQITALGMGIAGAPAIFAADWLHSIGTTALPNALIVPSSDNEIALVGAHGKQHGVLILAGTGSVAYGINAAGEELQVGGWGWLLGDEGSGYWIGLAALKALTQAFDKHESPSMLREKIFKHLNLTHEWDIIAWLYQQDIRSERLAQLAPLVLEAASQNDPTAVQIIEQAAQDLANFCHIVAQRLKMENPQIAFAGGLLTNPTILSQRLCDILGLANLPTPLHSPVIGAALLAKIKWEGQSNV